MALIFEKDAILSSDCTIIAHQTNCFSVNQTWIAKQIQEHYPEVALADKKYKLRPRQRLGKFSFALSADTKKLIFHLYGQFRYGDDRNYTDYSALNQAFEQFFQAVHLAKEKGYPIKIGLPVDIGSGVAGGDQDMILSMLEELSNHYQYDLYLYSQ